MTVLSVSQIVGAGIAPLSVGGGSSSGPSGAGLGARISNDWSAQRDAKVVDDAKKRRRDIRAARAKIEAKYATKAERLAANAPVRTTGSEVERASTRGSVRTAEAALDNVPSDKEFSAAEFRAIRNVLRQRYPGAPLSAMLQQAAKMEQMLLADPVAAYPVLVAAYSRAAPVAAYVEQKHSGGLRGSLQRARQDQRDSEDLATWTARFGTRLPKILAELEYVDRVLRADPAREAAKLAARYGAPAVEHEIEPYQAKQAHKQLQRRSDNILAGVQLAIQHDLISGDEDDLNTMAEVLNHPQFPWAEHRARGEHMNLYALRHAHEVAQMLRKGAPAKSDAGRKSIAGGPAAGQQPRAGRGERGTGGVRDSIARVRAQM